MPRVKLGVIGAGVIGSRHIGAISRSGADVELIGITDPVASARSVAIHAGVPFYTNAAAMLAELPLDGVVVATPTEHHREPTLQALQSGVHVLVEKPIAPTLEDAEQMIAMSRQTGAQVLVGHHRRYYEQLSTARTLIQNGTLGTLLTVAGQWNMRKHESYFEPLWRHKWHAGPVLTNLIHDMDALRYICGDVDTISAETSHISKGLEKEDAAALIIRFKSGALGTFILSDQATSPWSWEYATGETSFFPKTGQNAVRFMGTEASLEFPNLALWHHDGQPADWHHALKRQDMPMELVDAFKAQIDHFCEVIRGEESPLISAQDATDSLRATLGVFESALTGQRIAI